MRVRTRLSLAVVAATGAALLAGSALTSPAGAAVSAHSSRVKSPPPAASGSAGAQSLLASGGGPIVQKPFVYVDFWGSGWSRDPSGEAQYLRNFLTGVGQSADTWSASTTQYCMGVPRGTTQCGTSGTPVGMGGGGAGALAGYWFHGVSAPSHPRQGQLAAEAAAAYNNYRSVFGSNAQPIGNVQVVVATAHGASSSGFGTQYCAWHSDTSVSGVGILSYTNLPYITDAGASCGANFVSSPLDGISIVEGHEYAETVTDPQPSSGWVDPSGAENGDKCAWISSGQGAAADIALTTGTFAVQSLFSNAFSSGRGGCVISYP